MKRCNYGVFSTKMRHDKTERLLSFFIPILFFFAVLALARFKEILIYDFDEGVSLMPAFLHSKGHILYKAIWSDQPPFFTLLLSSLIKILGPSLYNARVLVLAFSSLLIWGLFKIISKTQNYWSALFAVSSLALTSFYIRLSVSVMRGLPAIALAVLSSYSIFLYQANPKKRYLIISSCLLALALQTKLFVIVFLPALLGQIIIAERGRLAKEKLTRWPLSRVLIWLIACALVYLYFAFVATSLDFSQLFRPYAIAMRLMPVCRGDQYLPDWMGEEYDIALLAIGALIFTRQKERAGLFFPLVCFLSSAFLTITHYPVWYSYRPLVFLPMCWLASFGFNKVFNKETWIELRSKKVFTKIRSILTISFLLFALILSAIRIPYKYKRLVAHLGVVIRVEQYREVINLLEKYGKPTEKKSSLVVTDWPILPFYAKLPTHPYLAVSSIKKVTCGLLKADDFINIIQKEKPEMVLLFRFPDFLPRITPYLKERYVLKYEHPHLFILKSLSTADEVNAHEK